ncbi:MAG TPA: hypothetical protein VK922_16720 [Gemmatimonadaceae bacterium]|nr:hypothetical protein [Gemmatimonadaceae bacterium]
MTAASVVAAPVITLGIGGVRTRFEAAEPELRLSVAFPSTRFLQGEKSPVDCVVRVRRGDADPGPEPPWFVSGGPWEVHRGPHGGDRVAFWTALAEGGREPMMRLDLSTALDRGEMTVAPRYAPGGAVSIGFPLDEYLTARLLARRGAVIVHASSVADDGDAFVFLGHSGAGKSTLAEIAESCGAQVMSDDRTVLRVDHGHVVAAGTPWHGSYASGAPDAARVRGLFLLEQAQTNAVVPLHVAHAFSELMVRTVRPTAEAAEQRAVVDVVQRIVETMPVAVLRFRRDPSAMQTVRDFVSA